MEPNFSGYVTRYEIECSDGRTIKTGSFAHMDGSQVPLVYQHNHTDVNQVLGYVKLKAKDDGIWGDVFLNETASAKNAAELVKHGDITKFSIWAKDLVEHGLDVVHGQIQETSLVLAGANSGANIYNVLVHSAVDQDDLLVVGGEIAHSDTATEDDKKTAEPDGSDDESGKTVGEVLETLDEDQKLAVNSLIDDVVKEAVTEALTKEETPGADDKNLEHDDISQKGTQPVSRNQFEAAENAGKTNLPELKHSDVEAVLLAAKGNPSGGIKDFNENSAIGSLREFVRSTQPGKGRELMHADTYGVDNIDILFPDAQALMRTPTWVDRRQDWVKKFISGTSHSPFSRVKTLHADITADEARAKGWIKGHEKTEEVFPVFKRVTGPTWVIKMQKLDRQDIIDITDFDVVAWMKAEMRGKLDEEIARAGLFGDGRPTMVGGNINPDKITDPGPTSLDGNGIRAIISDADLYVTRYDVPLPADPVNTDWNLLLDRMVEAGEDYMGSGNKTTFLPYRIASKLLTMRDEFGHRIYKNLQEVAGDMDSASIVKVPTDLWPANVLAITVDLSDYNFGTNRGGEVTLFDDFDIKFNQYLYLIETYLSGALTVPYAAQVFRSVESSATLVDLTMPTMVDNVITVPTQAGVVWKRTDTGATVAAGSTITLDAVTLPAVELEAEPSGAGYYFGDDLDSTDSKSFEFDPDA